MNASIRAPIGATSAPARPRPATLRAAALAGALLCGAALAADPPPTVRVAYGDLNLTSDAGSRILLQRLSAAAHRVCDDPGTRELRRVASAEACFREALDNAVVAVHSERLSMLYHARAGSGAT